MATSFHVGQFPSARADVLQALPVAGAGSPFVALFGGAPNSHRLNLSRFSVQGDFLAIFAHLYSFQSRYREGQERTLREPGQISHSVRDCPMLRSAA